MAAVDLQNPTERNKLIAAIVLGVLAIGALYFAFGRSLFSSSAATASSKSSPTPKPSVSPGKDAFKIPSKDEQSFNQETTPIIYVPGSNSAADPGRNIFAFYEPPPPTPYSPTPLPTPKPVTPPPPTPTPEILVSFVNPQTVYAGSKGFRLELNGDKFTPDAHIYWSQSEVPTTYVNGQKLVSDIPANLIAQEGPRQIIVQTTDGKKWSNQVMLTVQAPPKPLVQYIGMIGRKRYNNDTAYLMETGKTTPFGARLNDVVGGRFRLINISPTEVTFEDTNLGFKHKVPLTQATASTGNNTFVQPTNNGFPQNGGGVMPGIQQVNPNGQPDCIPGIPCNMPRYVPPQPGQPQPTKPDPNKKDVDDNDDGDNR